MENPGQNPGSSLGGGDDVGEVAPVAEAPGSDDLGTSVKYRTAFKGLKG